MCRLIGIPYIERPFGKKELLSADEVLVSSTTKLLLTASHVDGIFVKNGENKVSKKLISALRDDFFDGKN